MDIWHKRIGDQDPFWRNLRLLGLGVAGICYLLVLAIVTISGHLRAHGFVSVSAWFLSIALLFWMFIDVMGEETDRSDDPWDHGLKLSKAASLSVIALLFAGCLAMVALALSVGKPLLTRWNADLGLRSYSSLSLFAGVILMLIGYMHGVTPYRTQWRAWDRHGRQETLAHERLKSHRRNHPFGDAYGFRPWRVGPIKVIEWLPVLVRAWALFIIGMVLVGGGIAVKML